MYPESDDISEYLVSDAIVDWQTPAVRQKALELTRSLSDEVAKARCLYEWVRDAIPHSNDAGIEMVTCTASEVLHHGTGICCSITTIPFSITRISFSISGTSFPLTKNSFSLTGKRHHGAKKPFHGPGIWHHGIKISFRGAGISYSRAMVPFFRQRLGESDAIRLTASPSQRGRRCFGSSLMKSDRRRRFQEF